jgi:hypothetical protein
VKRLGCAREVVMFSHREHVANMTEQHSARFYKGCLWRQL